ncbi:uncharacterized protein LOC135392626 [Ornithodoros turicata]|uniref:uncharacterized protein LOC135392626 n=1 Tax=Ornithodoros turicata TaxID=34597 RepID=UPI0031389AE5
MHQAEFERRWAALHHHSTVRVCDGAPTQERSSRAGYAALPWYRHIAPRLPLPPPLAFTETRRLASLHDWHVGYPNVVPRPLPGTEVQFRAEHPRFNHSWTPQPYTAPHQNVQVAFKPLDTSPVKQTPQRAHTAAVECSVDHGSSPCSLLECHTSSDEAEPFDSNQESERLIKIHNLAEEIVAKNANTETDQEDIESKPINVPRRRKQKSPRKSAVANDPDFRGAVLGMKFKVVSGEPRLSLEHHFINLTRRRVLRPRLRYFSGDFSDSDDEYGIKLPAGSSGKQCASCSTKVTPLWRDAEDGTPLCNACGIRYKKYKVRCTRCWHIPRKTENTGVRCKVCGASYRYPVFRKSSLPC